MQNLTLLSVAKRLQAIAQAGIFYSEDKPFDRERYEEISDLSVQILSQLTDEPIEKIGNLFTQERDGYQTPKVDIRAVVFNDSGEILMVKEKVDGCWSLPGGWADVGYTPAEVAVKEVREETGLDVKTVRLLGVFDKKNHPHPPEGWYVYKIFILCEKTGGEISQDTTETSDIQYFSLKNLPPLSEPRNVYNQVKMMFDYGNNPSKEVYFD
ncbi:ADP-ribose pyrophosphatase YjhB (NUDIX family) [Arcicella aurantiaca]|uniref:ADP-ribose pyrophosphatase YjhB (NUDIX family) n=1 Tax=Arcicella aurantiaca TaxID=591202 RepID=A0A316DVG4_9BACT|nr:NUDIX hydrolase [Arcicella aurantiaca]PWK22094.1 ADP-ribose pyrophosphatase YjhB (NUDIX family) [Arcicella aurantiaca]